ncbi:MAG: hypothetical protein L0H64_22075 [Pseudonocardia sp.]|nr:hypothetical protein [Pseudonocardia sp.]
MSRTVRLLLVALLTLAGAAVAVPSASATVPCEVRWGSLAEATPALSASPVLAARAGRHLCFDRVVFDLDGPAGGYLVRYVPAVTQDGSGAVLPVPGGARLQVQLHHPAYDQQGEPTFPGRVGQSAVDVRNFDTLRSVVFGGSFEGYTTFGVGTRARLPFRVFTLDGPGDHSRIVVDVAHHWS